MEQVSDRLAKLSASATIAMNQKSKDLQAQGIDVINLSVGEPDFNTPDHIKAAAKKAIDDNYSFYPPVAGYPALRKAIVDKLKNQNGLDYTADQITVSNGAKHSIVNVLLCIINEGDEVIIPAPYWVSYAEQVKISEGTNVIIDTGIEDDFKVTPETLGYEIKGGRLVNEAPSPIMGIQKMAMLRKSLKRSEKVQMIAEGNELANANIDLFSINTRKR